MVNTVRTKGDWEARISNIKYSEALEIEKHENIKNWNNTRSYNWNNSI